MEKDSWRASTQALLPTLGSGNTVLIASTTYAEEIKQILQNELRWTGRIKKFPLTFSCQSETHPI